MSFTINDSSNNVPTPVTIIFTPVKLMELLLTTRVFTANEVASLMGVSNNFFFRFMRPYVPSIKISWQLIREIQALSEFDLLSDANKEVVESYLKSNTKAVFSEVHLAYYFADNFLVDNNPVTYEMGLYLLQFKWYSFKDITLSKEFDYDMQTYRYLGKFGHPYLKISTKNSKGKHLARYIKV